MRVRWYAHLPGVELEGLENGSIAGGLVVRLPFSVWARLESDFLDGHNLDIGRFERWYGEHSPVFFIGEADVAPDHGEAVEECSAWTKMVHMSLLLDRRTPLQRHVNHLC